MLERDGETRAAAAGRHAAEARRPHPLRRRRRRAPAAAALLSSSPARSPGCARAASRRAASSSAGGIAGAREHSPRDLRRIASRAAGAHSLERGARSRNDPAHRARHRAAVRSGRWWPLHPKDADSGETGPALPLYHGACGVIWALGYLDAVGAAPAHRNFDAHLEPLRAGLVAWLGRRRLRSRDRFLPHRRDERAPAALRPHARSCRRGSTRSDHRGQPRQSGARAHVGCAGHDARGAVPASPHRRGALGGAVSRQRAHAVVAACVVARVRVPPLGAGPLRPQEHVHRRGARLRGDRVPDHPGPRSPERRRVERLARVHRGDRDAHGHARRHARELARAARSESDRC